MELIASFVKKHNFKTTLVLASLDAINQADAQLQSVRRETLLMPEHQSRPYYLEKSMETKLLVAWHNCLHSALPWTAAPAHRVHRLHRQHIHPSCPEQD